MELLELVPRGMTVSSYQELLKRPHPSLFMQVKLFVGKVVWQLLQQQLQQSDKQFAVSIKNTTSFVYP
jgi:hypothetical protein